MPRNKTRDTSLRRLEITTRRWVCTSLWGGRTSADNALAESLNTTLKREVMRDRKVFEDPIACRQEVFW